ncbi:site-specific integrase [Massilia violaceinigra]|uniref:site-specific integrase n=1 Tax=Massilia violaceinigra TaxID=2045208 RepID=UPI0012FE6602|nr:site-specific integrase [Massilia violaceinigra]
MKFSVYYSDNPTTTRAGFGRAAHLPCIFDARPGYHRFASHYLLDRGLAIWHPITRRGPARNNPPSDQTMRNYAHWLVNFLEWAELRNIDLVTCTYRDHVQGRYQAEMLNGIWSCDGSGLSPRTVNLRVQQACDYLSWLEDNSHRQPFEIPCDTVLLKGRSSLSAVGHAAQYVNVRKGKVREASKIIHMPASSDLKIWLKDVYEKVGHIRGLMCETILLSGLRREELCCLRTNTLPLNPSDWELSSSGTPLAQQRVQIKLQYGTKGPSYGHDHGDKIGPARFIWIPLHLAERIHEYRMKMRSPALKTWVNQATTLDEKRRRVNDAVHLFIDEKSGRRVSAKKLYSAWTCGALPVKGWAPHQGRHWWACSTLLQEMKRHERLRDLGIGVAAALLESTAMSILRLQIQPQLGHRHDSSTMIYLKWAIAALGESLPILYESGPQ